MGIGSISLSDIQKESENIDAMSLHETLLKMVERDECQTFLEALSIFAEENDVDYSTIRGKVSPHLKGILYKEAVDKGMIKDAVRNTDIGIFF